MVVAEYWKKLKQVHKDPRTQNLKKKLILKWKLKYFYSPHRSVVKIILYIDSRENGAF